MFTIALYSGLTAVIEGEYNNRGLAVFWTTVAAIALSVALIAD